MNRKRLFIGAAASLIVMVAAGAAFSAWWLTRPGGRYGPVDLTWARVEANHDLWVGMDPSYPPFAYWTPQQIDGLEADIAREIGRRLGVDTHILIMGFDSLYDSLYTGYVDMVISGLQADPTQEHWIHHTRPYYDAGAILVSRADNPVNHMRALDGGRVAVEMASAGDLAAQRWSRRLHALEIVRTMLPDEAMQAVQAGEVDAALVDTISARLYLKDHPDLVMADETTSPGPYVIVMRKANYRLTDAVDRALDEMIADGSLAAIIERWL